MRKLRGYIPTLALTLLLLIGATTAQAGVIIMSSADHDGSKDSDATVVYDGDTTESLIGVIIMSIAGGFTTAAPGIMVSD